MVSSFFRPRASRSRAIKTLIGIWRRPRATVAALAEPGRRFSILGTSFCFALLLLLTAVAALSLIGAPPPLAQVATLQGIQLALLLIVGGGTFIYTVIQAGALILYFLCKAAQGTPDLQKTKVVLSVATLSTLPITGWVLLLAALMEGHFSITYLCLFGVLFSLLYSLTILVKGIAQVNRLTTLRSWAVCMLGMGLGALFVAGFLAYLRYVKSLAA